MDANEESDTLYHVPCGGNFYELPLANTEGGGFVYDVAPQSANGDTPSVLYVATTGSVGRGNVLYATQDTIADGAGAGAGAGAAPVGATTIGGGGGGGPSGIAPEYAALSGSDECAMFTGFANDPAAASPAAAAAAPGVIPRNRSGSIYDGFSATQGVDDMDV
jgi:hypothetical protein